MLWREGSKKPDNWGSQRVATAINRDPNNDFEGVTRGEIRAWVDDGGMPDAAHAVQTARELGWNGDTWTDAVRGIARLVIGVYAFGSVNERNFAPSWSPDNPDSEMAIQDALNSVGVGHQHVERDNSKQGNEIRPTTHATRLGRALVVAGAPVSNKNKTSIVALPDWVDDAPIELKTELALLFVQDRSVVYQGKATRRIQTDRRQSYFEDIAKLITDVTGEQVTASDTGVTISAAAVRKLDLVN
ncbi:hypothetical protein EKH57_12845 [Halorubrum sp. BOL3-1]|uniref:hypothetical protein n=1 Tax=Halorubrum sp. BOL3-1 TaxID=2497325 RepID=UPI001004EF2E|nr:hypothetical protein [Halorubrum sp. BOL3-1]QAU13526.1 hypothetical protein EKH57_12845 [Halorubrum sp. BOL3-1]